MLSFFFLIFIIRSSFNECDLQIGKVVSWSAALTILIAIPTVKVLDTATALENELKNSTMNREIHESTGFDIDPLNPAALVTL